MPELTLRLDAQTTEPLGRAALPSSGRRSACDSLHVSDQCLSRSGHRRRHAKRSTTLVEFLSVPIAMNRVRDTIKWPGRQQAVVVDK
jgi:hypothetical protein